MRATVLPKWSHGPTLHGIGASIEHKTFVSAPHCHTAQSGSRDRGEGGEMGPERALFVSGAGLGRAASKKIGIVAKCDEWVRAALVAALALAPSVAEYIVTDTYESAHAFCVAR